MTDYAKTARLLIGSASALVAKTKQVVAESAAVQTKAIANAESLLNEQSGKINVVTDSGDPSVLSDAATASTSIFAELQAAVGAMVSTKAIGSPQEAWKEARATIDRLDKILVDLRKTGFGVVTVIIGASAFLFGATNSYASNVAIHANASIALIVALLIVVLYFMDLKHQVWLGSAVDFAESLENIIYEDAFGITKRLKKDFPQRNATVLGVLLYLVLLFLSCAIFAFAIKSGDFFECHRITIYAAGICGCAAILGAVTSRGNYWLLWVIGIVGLPAGLLLYFKGLEFLRTCSFF